MIPRLERPSQPILPGPGRTLVPTMRFGAYLEMDSMLRLEECPPAQDIAPGEDTYTVTSSTTYCYLPLETARQYWDQYRILPEEQQKQMVSEIINTIAPTVRLRSQELSRRHKLPPAETETFCIGQLPQLVPKALASEHFNAFLSGCLNRRVVWKRKEILGTPISSEYLIKVLRWIRRADEKLGREKQGEPYTLEEFLDTAMPDYLKRLNEKQRRDNRAEHRLDTMSVKDRATKRQNLSNLINRATIRTARERSLDSSRNTKGAPLYTVLLATASDMDGLTLRTDNNIDLSALSAEQLRFLMTHINERYGKCLMIGKCTEKGHEFDDIADALGVTVSRAQNMYASAQSEARKLLKPQPVEAKPVVRKRHWPLRDTMLQLPAATQARLLMLLSPTESQMLMPYYGLLGTTRRKQHDIAGLFGIHQWQVSSSIVDGAKKLEAELSKNRKGEIPAYKINAITGLSLLPGNEREKLLQLASTTSQEAIVLAIETRNNQRLVAERLGVYHRSVNSRIQRGVDAIGKERIVDAVVAWANTQVSGVNAGAEKIEEEDD
jgi:hypothetical protein